MELARALSYELVGRVDQSSKATDRGIIDIVQLVTLVIMWKCCTKTLGYPWTTAITACGKRLKKIAACTQQASYGANVFVASRLAAQESQLPGNLHPEPLRATESHRKNDHLWFRGDRAGQSLPHVTHHIIHIVHYSVQFLDRMGPI